MSPDLHSLIAYLLPRLDELKLALVDAIIERLAGYSTMDPRELGPAVGLLLDDLFDLLYQGKTASLGMHLHAAAARRVDQGIPLADYIEAHLQVLPAIRGLLSQGGLADHPGHERALGELSEILLALVPAVARAYTAHLELRMSSKTQELQRVSQRLAAYESHQGGDELARALDQANEFSRRVIESLSSGLMVFASTEQAHIRLVSSRMEEILGIEAERLQGRPIKEVLHLFTGLDVLGAIRTVRDVGRLPLTKVQVTRPDGRKRSILVKASRMFDGQGRPEGTVVVADDVTERELLLDSFSRYVSGDLVRKLLARGEHMGLEGERQVCTILFADIRGFTGLAERHTPETLHRLINVYFRVMIDSITSHQGFIDKFVGDQVMAIFNSHRDPARDALNACNAALEIQARIEQVNRKRQASGEPALRVGIGVNTGEVLLGNVGSEDRMDFTAIGDAVNVAARLQGMAREYSILLGEQTATAQGEHAVVDLGVQALSGRQAHARIFALEQRQTA
jgi:PAS domain S-box-containing protein